MTRAVGVVALAFTSVALGLIVYGLLSNVPRDVTLPAVSADVVVGAR